MPLPLYIFYSMSYNYANVIVNNQYSSFNNQHNSFN
uniref:Uncharacterized protein n=1 Tax=Myoviridae sp. ctplG2 TaxID=2826700 RepID=A0A8S5LW05_9CAUD|nr:MAG TPA: hypothetical protein [Myoviridae sp. ctplG2]